MGSIQINTWDVCLAEVGFDEIFEIKVRPVLVVDEAMFVLDCLMMTSQPPRFGDYELQYWKEAGLSKPTVVRISKRLNLSKEAILRKFGSLQPADIVEIKKMLRIKG